MIRYVKLHFMLSVVLLSCLINPASAEKTTLNSINTRSMSNGYLEVEMQFSAPITMPTSFGTDNPPRLIFDFKQVQSKLSKPRNNMDIGALDSIEVSQADTRLRVMFNLKEQADYKPRVSGHSFYVTLKGRSPVVTNASKQRDATNSSVKTKHQVQQVDFRRDDSGNGRVIVALSDAQMGVTVNKRAQDVVVEFVDTSLPQHLQRRLDVTDFGTPVDEIEAKQTGGNTHMVIKTHGNVDYLSYQMNHQFIIDISKQSSNPALEKDDQGLYTGERLSLNFQDISVRAVLQLLADFTGINIVASDSVKGNITLRLNNVPWDEALAIILRTQGLGKRQLGNILMVAPAQEIAAREKEKLAASKEVEQLEPLTNQLVNLNYASADDIAKLIKDSSTSLLSGRGSVNVDKRTNTLIVQDTDSALLSLLPLIKQLDVPVQQVLIEARIVTVDTTFTEDLGIRFGITHPTHVSGTLAGANTMNNNAIATQSGTNPLLNVAVTDRLNIDLPARTEMAPATLGVALAKLGRGYLLDLELSALESQGAGELIASPRLVTANQKEAYIEKGEEIPYQESTSSGATSVEFKKAVLGLRVTPQITPDGKIIMDIKINQDRRSAEPEVMGVPAIDTEQIETQVLVDNGQTIVLGGIYRENKLHQVERVPFLGNLPVIGHLFRRKRESDARSELLIFITPKIVQQTPMN